MTNDPSTGEYRRARERPPLRPSRSARGRAVAYAAMLGRHAKRGLAFECAQLYTGHRLV